MFQQWLPQGSCARHQVMSESNGELANTEPCIERDMLRRPRKNIAPAQHAHANVWPRAGTLLTGCETPDNCVSPFAAMPRGTASKTASPCPSGRCGVCPEQNEECLHTSSQEGAFLVCAELSTLVENILASNKALVLELLEEKQGLLVHKLSLLRAGVDVDARPGSGRPTHAPDGVEGVAAVEVHGRGAEVRDVEEVRPRDQRVPGGEATNAVAPDADGQGRVVGACGQLRQDRGHGLVVELSEKGLRAAEGVVASRIQFCAVRLPALANKVQLGGATATLRVQALEGVDGLRQPGVPSDALDEDFSGDH
mmetsp:Transcript_79379/g.256626  ORF Transcript_79379/g.256626 Transcript_79379/m.256626 type:complete len:310 (+) Transcript_79379:365-1294(+)